uniref:Prominin n=1 Tax=Dendroctonus ponderosae TaxID=77166 RepID=A0AAR5PY24_DENPD
MWCFSRESATSPLPISWELDKLKEPTKDNLTRHNTANSGLQFLDIPLGDDLKIRDLQLENQFVLFEAFSKLTGYLLPSQFPIGLLNETLGGKQPLHFWVLQILKWEIPVVVWIIFWAMLALCFPLGVLVSLCCSPDGDGNCGETKGRWTETTLSSLLYLLLILLLCPLALILASNEQIAKTIGQSPALAALLYGDIGRFIRNSHMQISFVATSSTDIALEAIRQDLEDIGRYVGAPYQQQLCKETGLDRALIGLEDLKAETARVSSIVSDLLAASDSAKRAGDTLQDEMQEIARQLVSIQQQCDAKDRALCFAVQFPGYDTTIALENITNDAKIHQLERLTKDSSFNASIDFARRIYHNIPEQMAEESSQFVADIKSLLSRKRAQIYKSTHDLDMFARTMSQKVNGSRKAIFTQLENVVKWDLWRWMAILDLTSVLKICLRELSTYETFRLFNAFNHKTWRNFTKILDQFASTAPSLELLSPELQENLQTLASTTAANLSSYRQQLSGKERDLGPFAEQLNNIARQLLDPLVSRKFDYLAFSVRNIVQNSVQRLNGLRGNILYKITMLEVLLPPLNGRLHRSLSHLKTVQFFLDNHAWTISERAKRQFTARLKNYLEQLHDHVAGKVAKEIGKCRPLWAIFHASRFHVCKLMFDPVNAIAFGCHLLILILMAFGPIVVKLLRLTPVQGRQSSRLAHRDSRQGLILQEEPIWTTPSSE